MIWTLILGFLGIVIVLTLNRAGGVPWGRNLRRLHAGVADKAEWTAPNDVIEQVRHDYLTALEWLEEAVYAGHELAQASNFLTGNFLQRYQLLVSHPSRFSGIVIGNHEIQVRYFSDDGEHCFVIDCQTSRQMVTYDQRHSMLISSQHLDDTALVYSMVYDKRTLRWKIDAFIQELPLGWQGDPHSHRVRLSPTLPTTIGRDH